MEIPIIRQNDRDYFFITHNHPNPKSNCTPSVAEGSRGEQPNQTPTPNINLF